MPIEESAKITKPVSNIDYWAISAALASKKKLIAIVVTTATVLSVIVSLLLPQSFLATAVILLETDKSKMAGLSGFSDLAALAGVNVGSDGGLLKLYPTIIKSETLLRNVIYQKYQTTEFSQPVNLIEYWGIKQKTKELKFESALNSFRNLLQVSVDNKTLVITLSLSMPEPQLAADILNQVISQLDKFIRDKRTTSAGEQRRFVEGRIKEVERDLTRSKNTLNEFRRKTG